MVAVGNALRREGQVGRHHLRVTSDLHLLPPTAAPFGFPRRGMLE